MVLLRVMRIMADNVQKCLRRASDIKSIIKKLLILLQGTRRSLKLCS